MPQTLFKLWNCCSRTTITGAWLAFAMMALMPSAAEASNVRELANREIQRAAYAGDFEAGIANLDAIATAHPENVEAVFGKGALQVFAALARYQQGLRENATGIGANRGLGWMQSVVPLRPGRGSPAVLPENPGATPMTYATLRRLTARFVSDLEQAQATLANVGDRPVKVPLKPFSIAIDFNGDGAIQGNERLLAPLLAGARGWSRIVRQREAQEQELAFDTADASWLRGYCHVFLASANALLAFDFESSYHAAAHHLYGLDATTFGRELLAQMPSARTSTEIQADIADVEAELLTLNAQKIDRTRERELRKELRELPRGEAGREARQPINDELAEIRRKLTDRNAERRELRDRKRRLLAEQRGELPGGEYDAILDAVAYLHTMSWPVVEPDRLKAARRNLLQIMAQNEVTWRLARSETDDDREWLPNANQTTPFGGRQLTDEVIDSWLGTTRLAADVLNGEKLLPHPRFRKGINLKKVFETATELDLVLFVTGHGVLPYLEDGEIVDQRTWRTLTNPMGRDFATYAFWFN